MMSILDYINKRTVNTCVCHQNVTVYKSSYENVNCVDIILRHMLVHYIKTFRNLFFFSQILHVSWNHKHF